MYMPYTHRTLTSPIRQSLGMGRNIVLLEEELLCVWPSFITIVWSAEFFPHTEYTQCISVHYCIYTCILNFEICNLKLESAKRWRQGQSSPATKYLTILPVYCVLWLSRLKCLGRLALHLLVEKVCCIPKGNTFLEWQAKITFLHGWKWCLWPYVMDEPEERSHVALSSLGRVCEEHEEVGVITLLQCDVYYTHLGFCCWC